MEECRLETTDMVIARFIAPLRFVSSSCWTRSIRFVRPTNEEELARFPPELTSALSFPSSPSSGTDRYCPSRLPSLLFASSRPRRLFHSIVTASVFLDRRRHDSSSDCPYTNYVFRNGTINVVLWIVSGRVARCQERKARLTTSKAYLRYFYD